MFDKKLRIGLRVVGNDIPTEFGKIRSTLTGKANPTSRITYILQFLQQNLMLHVMIVYTNATGLHQFSCSLNPLNGGRKVYIREKRTKID